jgi:putative tricarboxylic transport membrane protein
MKNRWGEIVMTALVFGVGVVAVSGALQHPYYSEYGPGPGLFPFWLGFILAALSLVLFIVVIRMPSSEAAGTRLTKRQVWVALLFVIYIVILKWAGFALATAAFLFTVVSIVEGRNWREGLLAACVGPLFCLAFFQWWFEVPLPPGILFGEP